MAFVEQNIVLVDTELVCESVRTALAVERIGKSFAAVRGNHRTAYAHGTTPAFVRKLELERPPGRALHAERPVEPQIGIAEILSEANRIAVNLLYDGISGRKIRIDSPTSLV